MFWIRCQAYSASSASAFFRWSNIAIIVEPELNQNIPIHDVASVVISFDMADMEIGIEDLVKKLDQITGVHDVRLEAVDKAFVAFIRSWWLIDNSAAVSNDTYSCS